MSKLAWTLLATISLGGSIAAADDDYPDKAAGASGETISLSVGSVRGVAEDWLILPQGLELGSELKLITSDPSLGAAPLAFSDVAVLSLHARRSLFGRAEVSGAVDILPKQPSWSDEPLWQGASLGLRAQLGKKPMAFSLRAGAGPMLAHLGWWGQGSAGISARKRIHEIMTFEGAATAAGTYLLPRQESNDPAWLVEAGVTGSVLFRDPQSTVGGWVGIGYALPIADKGADPMSGAALDPQPRLDLHLGGVLAIVDQWDVFFDLAVIDRGDMGAMATRLPILDGGFDQKQVVLGLNYHVKDQDLTAAPMMQY